MNLVSFDRAADFYERTRAFPPGIENPVVDSVAHVLKPGAQLLEIGIGTGRIARPLLARGFSITGVDLSQKMMRCLIEKLPPESSIPRLIQGNAAQLPLSGRSFDAVIAVHVLHLIPQWQDALEEVRRVLKPDSSLLIGYHWAAENSPFALIRKKWREIALSYGYAGEHPGLQDFVGMKTMLIEQGADLQEWVAAEWVVTETIGEHIHKLGQRIWSSTWHIPDEIFPTTIAQLRTWVEREYNAMDQDICMEHKFIWQRFCF